MFLVMHPLFGHSIRLIGCSSSGLLIYAALVDLLAEDFLSEEANELMNGRTKAKAFAWLLLGGKGIIRPSRTYTVLTSLGFCSTWHVYCGCIRLKIVARALHEGTIGKAVRSLVPTSVFECWLQMGNLLLCEYLGVRRRKGTRQLDN